MFQISFGVETKLFSFIVMNRASLVSEMMGTTAPYTGYFVSEAQYLLSMLNIKSHLHWNSSKLFTENPDQDRRYVTLFLMRKRFNPRIFHRKFYPLVDPAGSVRFNRGSATPANGKCPVIFQAKIKRFFSLRTNSGRGSSTQKTISNDM